MHRRKNTETHDLHRLSTSIDHDRVNWQLFEWAKRGNLALVQQALQEGAQINVQDKEG